MNVTILRELIGKTPVSVWTVDDDELYFEMDDGTRYMFWHSQDCCEDVHIEDINGELSDLVGHPLLEAEEATHHGMDEGDAPSYESATWTFYKFANIKHNVTVRWIGTSNGYYSESVSFRQIK